MNIDQNMHMNNFRSREYVKCHKLLIKSMTQVLQLAILYFQRTAQGLGLCDLSMVSAVLPPVACSSLVSSRPEDMVKVNRVVYGFI